MSKLAKIVVALALIPALLYAQGLPIKSGASGSLATVDATPLAMRTVIYDSAGNYAGQKRTYSASTTTLTNTAAGTAPFFAICGSATKTLRIQRFNINGSVATAATRSAVVLQKTSTATSAGTATALTAVPHDSTSAASTASLVNFYTVLATTGTVVGTIGTRTRTFPVTATIAATDEIPEMIFDFRQGDEPEAVVLRGTAQCLQAAFGTSTTNAPTLALAVMWTEE